MNSKLVSIITPCYNSENYISETIKSVQNQTHKNWEMLITDDGSTDNSINIIEEFIKEDDRIKLFKNKNAGPAKARNNSIKHVTGHYMAFLDSDDLWFSTFLEKSIEFCEKSEGFVCASYEMKNDDHKEVYPALIVPERATYHQILKTNTIGCLTAFIDVKKLGIEYMPEVAYRQDMGLWIKYLEKIKYVYGNKEILAKYRVRDSSLSGNKKKLLIPQWNFYRKVSHKNILMSSYYMIVWAYYGLRKYR